MNAVQFGAWFRVGNCASEADTKALVTRVKEKAGEPVLYTQPEQFAQGWMTDIYTGEDAKKVQSYQSGGRDKLFAITAQGLERAKERLLAFMQSVTTPASDEKLAEFRDVVENFRFWQEEIEPEWSRHTFRLVSETIGAPSQAEQRYFDAPAFEQLLNEDKIDVLTGELKQDGE